METASLPPGPAVPDRLASIPTVLSAADAAIYRHIFAHQERADWAAADREIARLKDRRLVGHVLAERYLHPTHYRSSFNELAAWLKDYADHPDAGTIYRLAQRRAPKGAPALRKPTSETVDDNSFTDELALVADSAAQPDAPMPAGRDLVGNGSSRAGGLNGQMRARLRAGDLAGAESLLHTREATRLLSSGEYDYLKTQIATGWFTQCNDSKALELAREAASRSGKVVPRAHWIAGLTLFRQERFADAARQFEALARSANAQPWDVAAGAFWAARSHSRSARFDVVNYWFGLAAEHPRTFYGLLASRTLGVAPEFNWDPPPLTENDVEALMRSAAGNRAFALLQVGEKPRAERELRRLYVRGGPNLTRAVLSVAMQADMPALAMRLAKELVDLDGRRHDGAFYPIPPWRPADGFEVDPALVYAFMRQESGFNPRAKSPAGARGLMQLMPATAAVMNGGSFRGRTEDLFDPKLNVALGQKYIKHLLDNEIVQGDLIRLAAAYNGGPGNLSRWQKKQERRSESVRDDALLFIESLPSPETRHFISRVLYNYWMYAERLGQDTPSLEAVAAGDWPTYIAPSKAMNGSVSDAKN
ncbi:MAG: transglycosylase SLT domain-containing protein [Rhodospirillales bacterium]|nr:transglycosylase SLT domain-containing protein [Rhodospirillales bacterium]